MGNAFEHVGADSLIADQHDDPACSCEACERDRGRSRAETRRRDALEHGGIAPWAHELLGAGWQGGDMGEAARSALPGLATRALGDVFDQLARIGDEGRNRALYPPAQVTVDGVAKLERITRGEALELIHAAECALDYARVHVGWLPAGESANDVQRIRVGDRVTVAGGDPELGDVDAVYVVETIDPTDLTARIREVADRANYGHARLRDLRVTT